MGRLFCWGGGYMTIEEMKNVDVRTVDPDTLVDVNSVQISDDLGREDRLKEFIRQVKNPFCYRVGNVVVKNVYSQDGVTIDERFEQMVRAL